MPQLSIQKQFIFWLAWYGSLPMGCQWSHLPKDPGYSIRPEDKEVLVFHSDFEFSEKTRFVKELSRLRTLLFQKLALTPTDRPIHITLFESEQSYYQFLRKKFPNFPPRRALFVENGYQLNIYAHQGIHLKEDLRHEVTHGFLHGTLKNIPLWIDEGLAEYFEVAPSQHGLNRKHLVLLNRHMQETDWLPNLAKLESIESARSMTELDYAESWAWVHFFLESDNSHPGFLTQYLADFHRDPSAETVGQRLGELQPQINQRLLDHLASLRNTDP